MLLAFDLFVGINRIRIHDTENYPRFFLKIVCELYSNWTYVFASPACLEGHGEDASWVLILVHVNLFL